MGKMFRVTNLQTKRVYEKTEEQVNELRAGERFNPHLYQIEEIRPAGMPKEVADKMTAAK